MPQPMNTRALQGSRLGLAAVMLAVATALALMVSGSKALAAPAESRKATASARETEVPSVPPGKPNFVVIQTDDQTLDQLYATYTPPGGAAIEAMPNTRALIAERGATFNRYYTPYSLCAPSRVSLLTGRYAHNNNVRGNVAPEGGYPGFAARGAYSHNLPIWLQSAGYRTIHIGKFLNAYGEEPYDSGTEVPPGWNAWHSVLNSDTTHYFYGYTLNNNGVVEGPYGDSGSWETREYGQRDDFGCPYAPLNGLPCLYETDVFNRIATEELAGTPPEKPFYMQVDYTAPHGDFRRPAGPEPAPRDYESFAGAPLPHGPSQGFNEGNVNDKPSFIREAPFLTPAEIHTYRIYYQKALESLQSVDDGVKQIVDTLGAEGRLRNTYIIFTSDNGFFYGEHRLVGGKFLAYEPSTHLPFLIRGPGIKPGSETGELASTIDIAPTILELAHAKADRSIDGRSLYPYAHDTSLRSRRPLLFESFVQTNDVEQDGGAAPVETAPAEPPAAARSSSAAGRSGGAKASIVAPPKNYYGIRLGPYKYIEWPDGEKELYDITKDPYELNNKSRDPNYFPIRAFLHNELERLETCVGKACQLPAPKFPLTRDQQLKVKREKEKEQREREREQKKREEERRHHK
ncbi:MAG TPA: sulfatase [Solirubrobacterales bacterium]|nr:sulfatase [Solirubrobacterales bacterium]